MNDLYGVKLTQFDIDSINNILRGDFLTGSNKKAYEGCAFIEIKDDIYSLHKTFENMLVNNSFKLMIREIIDFGISRNRQYYVKQYKDTNFVLNKKYSYEDVCRLLNWEKNIVPLNIGGYKYDEKTNTYPVFINYNKSNDISDTIKYNDRFESAKRIISISKNERTKESNDVKQFLNSDNNFTKVYLFVRKNKDDVGAKEFYFLGQMHPTGFAEEIIMKNVNTTAVELGWELETPVEDSLYEYITN